MCFVTGKAWATEGWLCVFWSGALKWEDSEGATPGQWEGEGLAKEPGEAQVCWALGSSAFPLCCMWGRGAGYCVSSPSVHLDA